MPPKNLFDDLLFGEDKTDASQLLGLAGKVGTPTLGGIISQSAPGVLSGGGTVPASIPGGLSGGGFVPPSMPGTGNSGLSGNAGKPLSIPGGLTGGGILPSSMPGGTGGFAGGPGLGGGAPSPTISRAAASASTVPDIPEGKCNTRLDEIRKLVEENNNSKMDDEYIICQIYKESTFDPNAKRKGNDSPRGLMQIERDGVKQVYAERKRKELKAAGRKLSDAQKDVAFEEGSKVYDESIFDEATNIQLGTEYLQYWIDKGKTVEEGYDLYRGKGLEPAYYSDIKNVLRV